MTAMRRFRWRRLLRFIGASIVVAFAANELLAPIYRFPEPRPFHGAQWYNPYAELPTRPDWLRACFHAHSKCWSFLEETDELEDVWACYDDNGYDVIGVSNHQWIRPKLPGDEIYVPVYEHGYSFGQQHYTMIGADGVSWKEFPFRQGLRHKQAMIDHLAAHSDFLVINHPSKSWSFTQRDMTWLTGYQGVEVATRFTKGEAYWDAALSAGRLVWGVCGDDGHDLHMETHYIRGWLQIAADERSREGVTQALRQGRFYGVWTHRFEACDYRLVSQRIEAGDLVVEFNRPIDEIRFIGQDGKLLFRRWHKATARYTLRDDDRYVRVEAQHWTGLKRPGVKLFTNPVVRHDGNPFDVARATVLVGLTLWLRIACGALGIIAVGVWLRRRRRSPVVVPDFVPATGFNGGPLARENE